ncbi:MAG: sodium-dependent transporter [Armatimonadota bacterium]|nr:sodium-dependent transporter [Armatimonadota bacterium]MDR7421913.1 sodium-dependent transporter [Armatimonadota bacterium]MDR7454454.1 sodium-dependent transporter [Armatimonadota bacterium]MDR7497289.1 sodium-dependent transporter [Armatimonadota bacterium]MDR7513095.1 sodium-dependent transporter [Armatimonadota bacterium]
MAAASAPQAADEQWGSRVGFVLASAGSAVGLGNIWRFPSVAADNGGGAFVLLFLFVILLVGAPALMAEMALGRHTRRNPVDAFASLRPRSRWALAGGLGVLASFVILSYYSVIAGWVLAYALMAVRGDLVGQDATALGQTYANLAGHPWRPVFWHAIFMAMTVAVVAGGVRRGIERWAKILMPALVALLVVLGVRTLTLDAAREGAVWFFTPRWDLFTWSSVVRATGQVFFSFSLGMGVMITYGSYLGRAEDIPRSAAYVAAADAAIALLAGMIVIATLFAFGLPVQGGPGLLFITLPALLGRMPLGAALTLAFFAMVAMAALTSAVALLEVVAAFAVQRLGMARRRAVVAAAVLIFGLGVPSALSQGARPVHLLGRDFLSALDAVTSDLILPLGGLSTAVFVGWVWGVEPALRELRAGSPRFRAARVWAASVRVVIPVTVAGVLAAGLAGVR